MKEYSNQWIDSDQTLALACESLCKRSVLAFDTEFMRSTTFYPIAALFQICDGETTFLIDPLAVKEFGPLVDILVSDDIVKVFHSCSEDLEVIQYFLNCVPKPLIDTQIAAALANIGSAVGYANVVNQLLGRELEKGETRSDWLQRPLDEKQIHYAIQDVAYLLPVYRSLVQRLQQQGREAWLHEECHGLVENAQRPNNPDDYYLKIKSAWKLDRQQLAVLRSLSAWREQRARELDVPRNHVVPEKALLELSRIQVQDVSELTKIEDLTRRKRQQFGVELVENIKEARQIDKQSFPLLLPRPLSSRQRELVKSLKMVAENKAEQIQLPVEMLAKKNDIEFIVRSEQQGQYQLSKRLQGWRKLIVGDTLLQEAISLGMKNG